jgi:hypothetical protein
MVDKNYLLFVSNNAWQKAKKRAILSKVKSIFGPENLTVRRQLKIYFAKVWLFRFEERLTYESTKKTFFLASNQVPELKIHPSAVIVLPHLENITRLVRAFVFLGVFASHAVIIVLSCSCQCVVHLHHIKSTGNPRWLLAFFSSTSTLNQSFVQALLCYSSHIFPLGYFRHRAGMCVELFVCINILIYRF